jgi:hypothetical protein
MKIIFPNNVFCRAAADILQNDFKQQVSFSASSLIAQQINKYEETIGMMPTTDIINNKELFVSKKFGLSFENALCNSYIYFQSVKDSVSKINIFGDVSSIEAILTKILFNEMYGASIEIALLTDQAKIEEENTLIVGDKNFEGERIQKGISFAEEISETLSLPFVNYVAASKNEEIMKSFNKIIDGIGEKIYNKFEDEDFGEGLSTTSKDYIKENISSAIFEFGENDIEGLNQLLRLPYFHGIIKDIIEVKFA